VAVIAAAFAAVALFALEVGAAVIAAIAGAIIGLGFIIYSYWDSVLQHLMTGDTGKIEPPEALKAALYIVSIVAGAAAIVFAIPELIAVAVVAFVAAIVVGIVQTVKEVIEASKSVIPKDFQEHTRKAARSAEQVTSDAIIGLIAKLFRSVIEQKKPVIGDPVAETKPLPENQKPGEETIKEIEKPKEKDKFEKEKSSNKIEELDKDGGHSWADHGAQTTEAQHLNRLKTGITPGGSQRAIPETSSKFISDEAHLQAYEDALSKLESEKINSKGGLKKKVEIKRQTLSNSGISYSLDANGKIVKVITNSYTAVFVLDPTNNTYKLVTLFPE